MFIRKQEINLRFIIDFELLEGEIMIDLEGLEKLDLEKCLTVRKTLTDLKKVNSEVEMCYKQAQVEVSKATQNLEQIEFKQMILNNLTELSELLLKELFHHFSKSFFDSTPLESSMITVALHKTFYFRKSFSDKEKDKNQYYLFFEGCEIISDIFQKYGINYSYCSDRIECSEGYVLTQKLEIPTLVLVENDSFNFLADVNEGIKKVKKK